MYLIENMIKRGLSISDILNIIKQEKIPVSKSTLIKQLENEVYKLEYNPKVLQLYGLLVNQSSIEAKADRLRMRYVQPSNVGFTLRPGDIDIVYTGKDINRNEYLLVFLCNRISRIQEMKLEGYNEAFLQSCKKQISEEIQGCKASNIEGEVKDIKDVLHNIIRKEEIERRNKDLIEKAKKFNNGKGLEI